MLVERYIHTQSWLHVHSLNFLIWAMQCTSKAVCFLIYAHAHLSSVPLFHIIIAFLKCKEKDFIFQANGKKDAKPTMKDVDEEIHNTKANSFGSERSCNYTSIRIWVLRMLTHLPLNHSFNSTINSYCNFNESCFE